MTAAPLLLFVALSVALPAATAAVDAASVNADHIMEKNFRVAKVATLISEATMQLINDKGQARTRKLKTLSILQNNGIDADLMIRFEQPADVRGTKFLQIQHSDRDDDMWIYLPALHRSRRLVANNKRDSFVGSDFAYADILPLKPALFTNTRSGGEAIDGYDCDIIESVPKEDSLKSDLGYAKKRSWIRKDNAVELKIEYYDAAGKLLKVQTTADHVQVESQPQHWIARKREMIDRDTGHRTLISLDRIDTKTPIARREFTVEAIERD